MKSGVIFSFLSLIGLVAAERRDGKMIIEGKDLFKDHNIAYSSNHDIVSLVVALDTVDVRGNVWFTTDGNNNITVYFVEADIKENGERDNKGVSSMRNRKITKILDSGTDVSPAYDNTTDVYLSANDGIYVYNAETNIIGKYGNISDTLIGIVKAHGLDIIYVITVDRYVYKVTDRGNKKVKLDGVDDAQQIILDHENNLYYYGGDKVPYVVTNDGIKKIEGLPENPNYVKLIRLPYELKHGVFFSFDDIFYLIHVNGTSEQTDFIFDFKLTAYAPEAYIIQYCGYNKKIYEFNLLELVWDNKRH